MNWKQNKIIFNYIISKDYSITKDNLNTNNILYINWEDFEMKCKYFLAFTVNDKDDILWSCDNPYIDQKTKYFSQNIKNNLGNITKFSSEILNNLKKMIQSNITFIFEEENIQFIWGLYGDYKKYKQYYIIIDIIYL
jgi:hypothetical protein